MTVTSLSTKTAGETFPAGADFMSALIGSGFDNFETYIPYGDEFPYKLIVWKIKDRPWDAQVVNADEDDTTVAQGTGETAGEAIWDLTSEVSPLPWSEDYPALARRLIMLVARRHEQACLTEALAAADEAKDAADRCRESQAVHEKACADRDALASRFGLGEA